MIITRVTNTMMSNKLLNNLSFNLTSMSNLQNQLSTGRKYGHISDDPSALIYGQAARNKLARLSQYQGAVSTAQKWITQTEAGVMELQKMVGNIYEELINSGGAKTVADRQNLGKVVDQMKQHYLDTLNSSYGDRFVYGGYNLPGDYVSDTYDPNIPQGTIKPFTFDTQGNLLFNGFNVSQFDGLPVDFLLNDLSGYDPANAADIATIEGMAGGALADPSKNPNGVTAEDLIKFHQLKNDVLTFDVGPGINLPVTMNGLDILFYNVQDRDGNQIMRSMYSVLDEVHGKIVADPYGDPKYLNGGEAYTYDELTLLIKEVQEGQNHLLVKTAEIGGLDRRLELLEARYDGDAINYENMRSDAEDADIAEVIMYLRMSETVYQAALSAGARVIQPTLMDFLR